MGSAIQTATGGSVEVSVFFMCTSATNFSTCPNAADTKDGTIGMGCRGKGASSVSTECTGLSESGIGYVRVRKLSTSAAGQCISYALGVKVS